MSETLPLFTPPEPVDDRAPHQRSVREGGRPFVIHDEAVKAQSAAIKRAEQAADAEWRYRALDALYHLALGQPDLIANDLWNHVEKPREPRATGALMKQAAKRGWIAPTERFVSVPSVSRHAAPVRVWRSLIWEG